MPCRAVRHEPFVETSMDRELVTAVVETGADGPLLTVATAHLESPMSFQRPYIGPRNTQVNGFNQFTD